MNFYTPLFVNAVCVILLGLIWKRGDWLNLSIKVFLLFTGSFALFRVLQLAGYVVKVP